MVRLSNIVNAVDGLIFVAEVSGTGDFIFEPELSKPFQHSTLTSPRKDISKVLTYGLQDTLSLICEDRDKLAGNIVVIFDFVAQ